MLGLASSKDRLARTNQSDDADECISNTSSKVAAMIHSERTEEGRKWSRKIRPLSRTKRPIAAAHDP